MPSAPDYAISTDPQRLDRDVIHGFLREAYWSPGIPRDVLDRAIDNSIVFGLYAEPNGEQAGFARVVTDKATFGYLADVFVVPEHRGNGLGKRLIEAVTSHPDLQGLRRFILATADAHGLYEQYGWAAPSMPDRLMTIDRAPAELWPQG